MVITVFSVKAEINSTIGWWRLNQRNGIFATDDKGAHKGTLSGPNSSYLWSNGKYGNGLSFSENDSLNISSLNNTNFPQTKGTLQFWIKGDLSSQAGKAIFDKYDSSRNHIFIRAYQNLSCNVQITFQSTNGYVFASYVKLPDNQWNFVSISWNTQDNMGYVYVNGELKTAASISNSNWVPNGQIMRFGNGFAGQIDEIRLENQVLPHKTILEDYALSTISDYFLSSDSLGSSENISIIDDMCMLDMEGINNTEFTSTAQTVAIWHLNQNSGRYAWSSPWNYWAILDSYNLWGTGKFNNALHFGSTNSMAAASLNNTDFPQSQGTLQFWIKGDFTSQPGKNIFDKYDNNRNHIFVRTSQTSEGNAQICFQGSEGYFFSANVQLSDTEWNFLSISWDTGSKMGYVYLDGELRTAAPISSSDWVPDGQTMKFGNGFIGQLDEIRLLNSVMNGKQTKESFTLNYKSSGNIISKRIKPSSFLNWDSITWKKQTPSGTAIKLQVLYNDGTNWIAIPDSALAGNSSGFSESPIDISTLSPVTYREIKLKATLTSTSSTVTPILENWEVNYQNIVWYDIFISEDKITDSTNISLIDDKARLKMNGGSNSEYSATQQTVGWWHLNQSSGTSVIDSHGSHTGTLGGASPTAFWTSGKFSNGINLDGDDYLSISSLNNNSFPQAQGTLQFWIKGDFTSQNKKAIFDKYDSNREHIFIRTYPSSSGNIQISFQSSAGYLFTSYLQLTDNEWNFVCISWDTLNQMGYVYLNGELKHEAPINSILWTPVNQIMKFGSGFAGQFDEIRLVNRVMTEQEILEDFSCNYHSSGNLTSEAVNPSYLVKWNQASWTSEVPTNTIIKVQVLCYNGTDWVLVPDSELPGNSNGFSTSPIDLSDLDITTYQTLKLKANLNTSDNSVSPSLNFWTIKYFGIEEMIANAQPGDTISLPDGEYSNINIEMKNSGQNGSPITLQAATPGSVTITGESNLTISGEYLKVSGIIFDTVQWAPPAVIFSKAQNCVMTDCSFRDCGNPDSPYTKIVLLQEQSQYNIIEYCHMTGNLSMGMGVQVHHDDNESRNNTFRYNYYKDILSSGGNGRETIQVGQGVYSFDILTNLTVEKCLFDNASGDSEIISNKSSGNIYQHNTFINCQGALSLRGGNNAKVNANFFFDNTQGVALCGQNHVITNNYFENTGTSLSLTGSTSDGFYADNSNCILANNTIVNSTGIGIKLGVPNFIPPHDCQFINNIIIGNEGSLINIISSQNNTWTSNIVWATGTAQYGILLPQTGFIQTDPLLTEVNSVYRLPTGSSPAKDSASIISGLSLDDIDGQSRGSTNWDIGCDEFSSLPVTNSPLTPQEVGPRWMISQP